MRDMLCLKQGCWIATEPLDRELTFKVARDFEKMEGAVELWRCPKCGRVYATRMTEGVRRDMQVLVPVDEKEA